MAGDTAELGRPVGVVQTLSMGFGRSVSLVNPRNGEFFGIELTAVMQRILTESALLHVRRLAYGLGAMIYHCTNLADIYVRLCRQMSAISRIPGADSSPSVGFGYNEEPYFEFDAIVTAARRLYDAPRDLLWGTFGGKPDQRPKRLEPISKLRT